MKLTKDKRYSIDHGKVFLESDIKQALELLKTEINKSIMNWSSRQILDEINKAFPAFKEESP